MSRTASPPFALSVTVQPEVLLDLLPEERLLVEVYFEGTQHRFPEHFAEPLVVEVPRCGGHVAVPARSFEGHLGDGEGLTAVFLEVATSDQTRSNHRRAMHDDKAALLRVAAGDEAVVVAGSIVMATSGVDPDGRPGRTPEGRRPSGSGCFRSSSRRRP
jgi:hypothetical protein